MEATVRLVDRDPTVSVQVQWRGAELNLLRTREEPVERFLQRLGLSCNKHAGRLLSGADKKRAKKEQKKSLPGTPGGEAAVATPPNACGVSVALFDASGQRVADGTRVDEALLKAVYLEIEGEKLPISVNPPSLQKLEVFGRSIVGCPLAASLRCEFCNASAFRLRWLVQASAGSIASATEIGQGYVLWVPEDIIGHTLTLVAESSESSRVKGTVRIGLVEQAPQGWPDVRLEALGARDDSNIRVVSYNILAVPYARTQLATQMMYPYCPPHALDFAYRQPLLGREIRRLDGDLIFLQECTFSTYRKFFLTLFGDQYHMRCTLKASQVSEGCLLMIQNSAFEVLEERDYLFRNHFRTAKVFRSQLSEVSAKWPDFLSGILPRMSTVFQVIVVRHRKSGEVIILANTHLFYHPLARHIRLLQVSCLLHTVHEFREQYQDAQGRLPHVILAGDLNCLPETAAVTLLLEGKVSSDHPDWEHSSQFTWRDEEIVLDAGEDDGEVKTLSASVPSMEVDAGDDVELLPQEQWQPGSGIALQNPLGKLTDTYAGSPVAFTNYVQDFTGKLDYILTAGDFKVAGVMPAPSTEDIEVHGGLPSVLHPSDHLSLAVDLELPSG